MALPQHSFKRLVLGLQPSAPDQIFRLAAGFAQLLDVELLGLFLEDTSLHDLASIPFARELRPLNGGWHSLDLKQVSRDFERAARNIERMLAEAAKNLATRYQFEVVRGPLASTLQSESRVGDIVMIIEPASPAERATQQFAWLIEAAFRSTAAVMIVPTQIARSSGPVVALMDTSTDPSLDTAAAIASAANEDLVIVDVGETAIDDAELRARAAAVGCRIRHIAVARGARSDISALDQPLDRFEERIVVVTRGVFNNRSAAAISSTRSVPVLVVEPEMQATA